MTTVAVNPRMRAVLEAPKGRRFSRPAEAAAPLTREQRLLAQMRGNPRVTRRLEHGVLPKWMLVAEERREQRNQDLPRPTLQEREPVTGPRVGGRHRSRRRWAHRGRLANALSYAVVAMGGALVGQVMILLM